MRGSSYNSYNYNRGGNGKGQGNAGKGRGNTDWRDSRSSQDFALLKALPD